MKETPLVSLIIPNFETPFEDFLICLESILKQSYSNWECLVIDDGSNSDYKQQYDSLKNDSRIQILEKENEGPSVARNYGIDHSNGELICFCDADDLLKPNFLDDAVRDIEAKQLDLFIGGTEVMAEDKIVQTHQSKNKGLTVIPSDKLSELIDFTLAAQSKVENAFLGNIMLGRVYPKVIARELAEKVLFDKKITIHEDNLWSIEVFKKAENVGISDQVYYSYKINPYSITHKTFKKGNLDKELEFAKIVINQYSSDYPKATRLRLLNIFIGVINMLSQLKLGTNETKDHLRQFLNLFDNSQINFKDLDAYSLSKYKKVVSAMLNIKSNPVRLFLFQWLLRYKHLK